MQSSILYDPRVENVGVVEAIYSVTTPNGSWEVHQEGLAFVVIPPVNYAGRQFLEGEGWPHGWLRAYDCAEAAVTAILQLY